MSVPSVQTSAVQMTAPANTTAAPVLTKTPSGIASGNSSMSSAATTAEKTTEKKVGFFSKEYWYPTKVEAPKTETVAAPVVVAPTVAPTVIAPEVKVEEKKTEAPAEAPKPSFLSKAGSFIKAVILFIPVTVPMAILAGAKAVLGGISSVLSSVYNAIFGKKAPVEAAPVVTTAVKPEEKKAV